MSGVQSKLIRCWTEWLKGNKASLKTSCSSLSHSQMKQRDENYRYTLVHAIVASCPSEQTLNKFLSSIQKRALLSLLTAKDKDGDIPLQSAVKSNVDVELVKLLLSKQGLKWRMLKDANKKGDVALRTAFEMRRWPIVEVLLDECVKSQFLPHLTGVGDPNHTKGSSTLLHKAMKRGHVEYLKILLEVCRKHKIRRLPALLVPNKSGYTPWYYLLNQKTAIVEEALEVLSQFEIDINKLYCDEGNKQYIPHVVYRSHNTDLMKIWKRFGGRIDLKDSSKQTPPDRVRRISYGSVSSCAASPVPHPDLPRVEPLDDDVFEPPQAVCEPPQAVCEPPQAVCEPPQAVCEPPQAVCEPPQVVCEPPQAVCEPPQAVYEPPQAVYEPPQAVYEPPQAVGRVPNDNNHQDVEAIVPEGDLVRADVNGRLDPLCVASTPKPKPLLTKEVEPVIPVDECCSTECVPPSLPNISALHPQHILAVSSPLSQNLNATCGGTHNNSCEVLHQSPVEPGGVVDTRSPPPDDCNILIPDDSGRGLIFTVAVRDVP